MSQKDSQDAEILALSNTRQKTWCLTYEEFQQIQAEYRESTVYCSEKPLL